MFANTSLNSMLQVLLILVLAVIRTEAHSQCQLPVGNPCTDSTSMETRAQGLGVYYKFPCVGAGCGFMRQECRLCWVHRNAPGKMDRPKCPLCVMNRERRINAKDRQCQLPDGNSCTSTTPNDTKLEGLGVYYEYPCLGAGCGFLRPECRLCWVKPDAPGRMGRVECPSCVSRH